MKLKLASDSGMTLIEIIAALVILIIMVAGFATLFSFAGTSVFISGHDSVANEGGRTGTENLLAGPVSEDGADVVVSIDWNDSLDKTSVDTKRESTDVPIVRGPDGSFDLYRRPDAEIEIEHPAQRPFPILHTVIYDLNGGYLETSDGQRTYYRFSEEVHAGQHLNPHELFMYHPDGLRFSHWFITTTREEWNWQPRGPYYDIFRSLHLVAVWKEP